MRPPLPRRAFAAAASAASGLALIGLAPMMALPGSGAYRAEFTAGAASRHGRPVAPSQPSRPGAVRAYLPTTLLRGPAPVVTPWPSPVPGETSRVLAEVPVPPEAHLTFYEQRPAPEYSGGSAVASYAISGTMPSDLAAWIEARLPSHGWQREGAGGWIRYGPHRLTLQASATAEGTTLELRADAGSAAAADTTLATGLPLFPSTRRRFDPLDLISEELVVPEPAAEAYEAFSATLASAGWLPDEDRSYDGARIGRFVRDSERTLLAAWGDVDGPGAEVALGTAGCLPPAVLDATRSVYLQDVAGAPGGTLVGYERLVEEQLSLERWREGCLDLDMLGALLSRGAGEAWTAQEALRTPGELRLDLVPLAGLTVTVRARPVTGGQVAMDLERHQDGRARTAGSSLLSRDVRLPARADARSMTVDAPGWRHREVYDLPGLGMAGTVIWLRERLPAAGWTFEREEPPDGGSGLVFYSGGEELLMEPAEESVAIQRRRPCADGIGRVPGGAPVEARWLFEVPVVPGAAYDGWDTPVERYRLSCADLGLLTDWYRARLEEGNWALAGTSTPSDLARDLLFVRPSELGLPHEMRTAWARVVVRRLWPYHYDIALSRDPAGIRTP